MAERGPSSPTLIRATPSSVLHQPDTGGGLGPTVHRGLPNVPPTLGLVPRCSDSKPSLISSSRGSWREPGIRAWLPRVPSRLRHSWDWRRKTRGRQLRHCLQLQSGEEGAGSRRGLGVKFCSFYQFRKRPSSVNSGPGLPSRGRRCLRAYVRHCQVRPDSLITCWPNPSSRKKGFWGGVKDTREL